ncbi:hypothetical protein HPB47_003359 [Ixodes persulcatus]|uniref:Uncharacterized protein n=1 Tax=Ixodes persulcatus TaxID=34615 RepID=A0AC60PIN0_IXOPE|nr:hypothetical protein HPB47_003359 [Ixodes persulcatus]
MLLRCLERISNWHVSRVFIFGPSISDPFLRHSLVLLLASILAVAQQRRLLPLAFFVGTCTTNSQGGNIRRDGPSASATYFVATLVPIQMHGRCRMPDAWSETCSECHDITEALFYVVQLFPSVFLYPGSLQILDVQEEDKGNYECIAENSVGTAISPIAPLFVRVRRVPPYFTVPPELSYEVTLGANLNLTCVAVGSPMPYVRWRQGHVDLTPESDVPVGRSVLLLENIKESANYTCVAASSLGSIEHVSQVLVQGKMESPRHKVEHPCEPGLPLYFMRDTPHLIKCVRNHLLRHQYGMMGEHKVDFNHYRLLFEADGSELLRAAHKLTKEHVAPDNLRKMNVRLAVQLFSHSTACGLKVYQRLKYPGLEDCGGTVEFTKRINDVFDALNVKLPSRGIKEDSKEIKIITDFLELVDETEHNHNTRGTVMFASPVTMQSLRVTLASVRDLISDLLRCGAHYVLTGKLNQDPLEAIKSTYQGRRQGEARGGGRLP